MTPSGPLARLGPARGSAVRSFGGGLLGATPDIGDPPTVPIPVPRVAVPAVPAAPDSAYEPDVPATRPPGAAARALRRVLPDGWRGARTDPGRPGAVALVLVVAVAAVVAAVGVWHGRPQAEPLAGLPVVVTTTGAGAPPAVRDGAAGTSAASSAQEPSPLVVSVSGRVQRPGLVELPDGARVADALDAAGGALPGTDLSTLNLARRLADGEQVAVGVPPAPDAAPAPDPAGGAAGAGGAAAGAAAGGPVDLNTATAEQLDALPGVGPVTVQRILEWRAQNGRFARVEQLREIEGIGERRFAQLRELVVV